jgi:putative ABC transport system permease protein
MLSNFVKVAFRVFVRNRAYTLINIFGLAIGLTFSIIIFLYAYEELSYDRFHANSDRVYRVGINARIAENKLNLAFTSTPLAKTMLRDIPDVEQAVRVARFGAWLLRNDSIRYNEDNLIFSDTGFFKVFSFPLIKGSPDQVLKKPNSVVLCESAAEKYFPGTDPVGRRLRVENDSTFYLVTGVMKDVPENSHLKFDMVGAISTYDKMLNNDRWIINYLYTYILLNKDGDIENVKTGLSEIVDRYVIPDYQKLLDIESAGSFRESNFYQFIAQPLTDIHFDATLAGYPAPIGKYFYLYLFIVLALIILVLSCMNFVNLVTAHSVHRAREVGIRKISGSGRNTLVNQFLLESSLMAFLAMALALFLVEIALPSFSKFIGLNLSLGQLLNSAGIILMAILILLIGIISGLYPAWYLSSYNPQSVLRNHFSDHPDKGHFRTAITIFQLFLAVGVLTMTIIVQYQFRYLVNKNRGYDSENLMVIRRPDALTNRLEEFKEKLTMNPGVTAVTNATNSLGSGFPRFPYHPEGRPVTSSYSAATLYVSYGFDSAYRINMAEGRFFDRKVNDTMSCVLNETALNVMGIDNPIGKVLIQLSDKPGKTTNHKIIGVVKDFNFETLENPIRPLVILFLPGNYEGYMTVRLTANDHESTIRQVKGLWERYTDAYPFVYYFLDEDRQAYYKPVQTTARIFIMLSVVTTLMACLSLFALVSFYYNRKQKEIGILKAMGASNVSILLRRTGEIFVLVMAASVAAWIGAYFLANFWLRDYANHINLNVFFFFSATLAVTIISIAAVYYHTYLAARANPGTLLKHE